MLQASVRSPEVVSVNNPAYCGERGDPLHLDLSSHTGCWHPENPTQMSEHSLPSHDNERAMAFSITDKRNEGSAGAGADIGLLIDYNDK